jgi:hypothetical protein
MLPTTVVEAEKHHRNGESFPLSMMKMVKNERLV